MAALAGIVVLVVIAFLVEAAATHRKFAVTHLRLGTMDAGVLRVMTYGLLELSRIRNIGLPLEDAHLLFVCLLALHIDLQSSPAAAFSGLVVPVMGIVLSTAAGHPAVAALRIVRRRLLHLKRRLRVLVRSAGSALTNAVRCLRGCRHECRPPQRSCW
nr:hypothetical protein BDOA9_0138520 [Bradyrhizobium sp. DOA9]